MSRRQRVRALAPAFPVLSFERFAMTTTRTPSLPLPFGDRRVALPAGATAPASWLARAGHAVWHVLQDMGQRHNRHQLLHLARDTEASRPGLAAQLRNTARHGWL